MTVSNTTWRIIRAVIGLGLLVYVLSGSDWNQLTSVVRTPWLLGLVVALPVAGALLGTARLRVLFDAQGLPLRFATGFQITAIAAFFNLCIPGATGGDVVKMWYLGAVTQRRVVELAAIWFVDRLTGLMALLVLVSAVGAVNLSFVDLHPVLRGLLAGAVVALGALAAAAGLGSWTFAEPLSRVRLPFAPVRDLLIRVAGSVAAFRRRPGALVKAILISFGGHLAMMTAFVALGRVLVPDVAPQLVCLLVLFGMFANAVPLTPGGLGVGETAFETLFRLVGAAGGAGLLVVWRIGMLPFCLFGLLLYMVGVRRRKQSDDQDGRARTVVVVP